MNEYLPLILSAVAGIFVNPILSRLGIRLPSPFQPAPGPSSTPTPAPAPTPPPVAPAPSPLPGITPDAIVQLILNKLSEWIRSRVREAHEDAVAKFAEVKESDR